MACYEYKVTFEYAGGLRWDVSIYQREVGLQREREAWRCILHHEAATLEGHLDPRVRLKQVLRSLGT
jgi:hypothetical protein